MGGDEKGSHRDSDCPGMWRLVEAVIDPLEGSTTVYRCELCEEILTVPTGGVHPTTA